MRPIVPIMPKDSSGEVDSSAGSEILWHGVLPLRILRQKIRLDIIITSQAEPPNCLTGWRRGVTLAILQLMLFGVLLVLLAGVFLLFYLVKKAMGIDFFANFHLF